MEKDKTNRPSSITDINDPRWWTWAIIGLTGLLYWCLLQVTPYYYEDISFGHSWQTWGVDSQAWADWMQHFKEDSPRWQNLFFPVFLAIIPKWIINIVTTLAFTSFIPLALILTRIGFRRPLWTLGLITLIMFCCPWSAEPMTCVVFSTNYMWPLPMIMLCFLGITGQWRPNVVALGVLAFFTGWAQELFGAPLLMGSVVYAIVNRHKIDKATWAVIIGVTLGLTLLIVGSISSRYIDASGNSRIGVPNLRHLAYGVMWQYMALMAIGAWLVVWTKHKLAVLPPGAWMLLLTATIVAAIDSTVLIDWGYRTSWPSQMFGIITLAMCLNALFPTPVVSQHWLAWTLGIANSIVVFGHLIVSICFTNKVATQMAELERDYFTNPDREGYFSPYPEPQAPVLALNKGQICLGARFIRAGYRTLEKHGKTVNIPRPVPAIIRDFTPEKAEKMPGDNPFYYYKDCLVASPLDSVKTEDIYILSLNHGVRKSEYIICNPFTADDGRHWIYVTTSCHELTTPLKHIVAMDNQ